MREVFLSSSILCCICAMIVSSRLSLISNVFFLEMYFVQLIDAYLFYLPEPQGERSPPQVYCVSSTTQPLPMSTTSNDITNSNGSTPLTEIEKNGEYSTVFKPNLKPGPDLSRARKATGLFNILSYLVLYWKRMGQKIKQSTT